MCGIAGIFAVTGAPPTPDVLAAMARSIKHRGPDDDGVFCDGRIGLTSTRLSILDLSANGHMPMVDEQTGLVIVHNGEVYNYREIREELGAHRFRTETDTEVVLRAYAAWGEACLAKLNGIFAFAIWDPRDGGRLFCARDRLGVKPFLYAQHEGRLVFGSEAKALFEAGVAPAPNWPVVADFLAQGIYDHSAQTFFDGIDQLPPGHMLSADRSGIRIRRYWDLEPTDRWSSDPAHADERAYRDAQDEFLFLIEDALRLQLRSDVPVAVNASGGLDSTLIVSLVNKLKGEDDERRIYTYCYGDGHSDERAYAREVAAATGWNAEFFELSAKDVPDLTAEAIHFQEQPFPGVVTLARHNLIRSLGSDGAKVILEGQGGDEIAAGYQYVMGPHLLDLIETGRADLAADEILAFARVNGMSDAASLRKCMSGLMAYQGSGWAADGNRFIRPDCLSPDFLSKARDIPFERRFASHLQNMQYRDIFHTKLPRILRSVDRASMAYGREIRVPLLDHRLVEFSFALPSSFKIRDGVQRAFFRDAVKPLLSIDHFDAPKRALVDPQREWLMGPLSGWVEDVIRSRSFAERGVFDVASVDRTFEAFKAGESATSFHVWQWVNVELWLRHWGL